MADQPSTSGTSTEKTSETSEYDPCLDFYSEKFDPLKALQAAHIKIPLPDAPVLDNIAKYEAVLTGKVRSDFKVKSETAPNFKFERRFKPHQMPIPAPRREFVPRNVLTQMDKFVGPLALLKKCVDQRNRLKVWTRHSHGIRGYCLAFCVAFDKHWNLALEDVIEVWTRPRSRKVPALDSMTLTKTSSDSTKRRVVPAKVTITKTTKKQEFCERHVPQLIVRGEQIAFINVIKIE